MSNIGIRHSKNLLGFQTSVHASNTYTVFYSEFGKFTSKDFFDPHQAAEFFKEQNSFSELPNLPFFKKSSVINAEGTVYGPIVDVPKRAILTGEVKKWEENADKELIRQVVLSLFKKKFGS